MSLLLLNNQVALEVDQLIRLITNAHIPFLIWVCIMLKRPYCCEAVHNLIYCPKSLQIYHSSILSDKFKGSNFIKKTTKSIREISAQDLFHQKDIWII